MPAPDWYMAQDSVLGAMLISPEISGEAIATLRVEDFDGDARQAVFRAFRDLLLSGERIDPVTVLHKIGRSDQSMRDYLVQLMEITPTAANFREYAAIVRAEAKRARLRDLGERLADCPDLETGSQLVTQAAELLADRRDVRSATMEEALTDFYARQEARPEYLTWGLSFLDDGLYVHDGSLVILGGRPSDGKTALALTMAYHQAKSRRVGFFSLETDRATLFDRLFGAAAKVSSKHIKRRELTDDDCAALAARVKDMQGRQLELVEAAGMTTAEIQAYALARQYQVIYIDYLQLIRGPARAGRFDLVTQISMDLHTMAARHGITVVALSQLSRPAKDQRKRPPILADLRESGQIEQDADVVMFIYRDEPDRLRSPRTLRVAKNKEGETGQVPLRFDGETQTFREDYDRPVPPPEPHEDDGPAQVTFTELAEDTLLPF